MNIFAILLFFKALIIFLPSPLNTLTLFNSSSESKPNKLAMPLIYGSQPIIAMCLFFSNCHFICSPEPNPISSHISCILLSNNSDKLAVSSYLNSLLGSILFMNKVFFYLIFYLFFFHAAFYS